MPLKIYGQLPSGKRLEAIKKSSNYRNGAFQNLSPTSMIAEGASFAGVMLDFIKKPKTAIPSFRLPSVKSSFADPGDAPVITWFGHSSYLVQLHGKNILVDPVMTGNASPVKFMVKAFDGSNVYQPGDLPEIDVLLLTHDHYDHLDYKTIIALLPKIKRFICPLGVGAHLEYWGVKPGEITELDWWEETEVAANITIHAAPARHFSGRGLKRSQALWNSYALLSDKYRLYLGGDSGYDEHFKTIGATYGPFDLAILETGQYNTAWKDIHMMPEEVVKAAIFLRSKVLMPVHWGKFSLALHPWDEPILRVTKAAGENRVTITTPLIGEQVIIDKSYPSSRWWEQS